MERTIEPGVAFGRLVAPRSKSYTHRALLLGLLGDRSLRIVHPALCDDTAATVRGVNALGGHVTRRRGSWIVSPRRSGRAAGRLREVDCGGSATSLRFLMAAAATRPTALRLSGDRSLRGRPTAELVRALRSRGARVECSDLPSGLPVTVRGPIEPGAISIDPGASSQFVSGLLLALPALPGRSSIRLRGPAVSTPYIRATLEVLREGGIPVRSVRSGYDVPGAVSRSARSFRVPADLSSSSYLLAAAALTGGTVTLTDVVSSNATPDRAVLSLLRRFGAAVEVTSRRVRVTGERRRTFSIHLDDAPDLYPLAGVLAAFSGGRCRLTGAPHAAWKETDRIEGTARLARRFGAKVRHGPDRLEITAGRLPRSVRITGSSDHRPVMAATVGACALPRPSRVGRSEAVRKSYPGFWDDLLRLGIRSREGR